MFDEFDFGSEFMTDEEVEEMLDNLVTMTAEQAAEDEMRTAILNPYKLQQIIYTYKVLKYLTQDMNAKVTYELHKPYKSMGSVKVIGSNLEFRNPEWFMKAVEFASNFDVYPRADGTVQMDFTFHGLTVAIE